MIRNRIRAGLQYSLPTVARRRRSFLALSALVASAFFGTFPTRAAVRDWDGDTSTVWNANENWFNDAAPTVGFMIDTAHFNLPVYGGNPVYAPNVGSFNIGGIMIGSLNGPMTISGTSLGIGSSGLQIANGAGALTIAVPALTTNGTQSWTNNSAFPLIVPSTLTLGSTTVLTISGSNSTVFNGHLTNSTGNRTLNASSNAATILNGNVYLSELSGTGRTLTLGGTGHLVVNGTVANFNGGTGTGGTLAINNAALLVTLNGTNTHSGTTSLMAGSVNVNSPTAFGTGSMAINDGVTLDNTTGKPLALSTVNSQTWGATNFFNGSNDLHLGNGGASMTAARTWSTIGGNLTIGGAITGTFNLTKSGSGTLTLTGANSYGAAGSGSIAAGGNLVFDYGTADPLPAAHRISFQLGQVTIKGKSGSGNVTNDTLTQSVFNSDAAAGTSGASRLVLDANGGSGVHLTIGTFLSGTAAPFSNLIDNSANAGGSLTITAFGAAASTATTDNIIITGNSTAADRRAATIFRDSSGNYGFAKTASATGGAVSALLTGTPLTAVSNSAADNYLLDTPGTLNRTAALEFGTLTIDSTQGAITLDSAGNNWTSGSTPRAVLLKGSNPIALTSSGGTISSSMWFHNYSTDKVTIGIANNSSGGALVLGGNGFYEYTVPLNNLATGYSVVGSLVRLTNAQDISGNTSKFYVSSGGVLEIGADLNGGAGGDFSLNLGFNTANRIAFLGDSGLSASGTSRAVNFGGAGATVTWGKGAFLTNGDGTTDGGHTLKLSSAQSDASVEIQNPLNLGARLRIVDVANGTAPVDAILSGVLSGTVNNAAPAFTKNGAGTLTLAVANTYSGITTVNDGTLAVTGSLANNGPANIYLAAPDDTLAGNATITRRVAAAASYTLGSAIGLGSTAISIDPVTATPLKTTAAILAGTASSQADVGMQWRTRSVAESTGANAILSDVVNLTGITSVGSHTDVFLLEMSYTDAALAALGMNEAAYAATGILRLGWYNGTTWTTAVEGNSPASVKRYEGDLSSAAFLTSLGVSPLSSKLGSYGVDTANNKVWAVLNHNSEFAVIPEPSTLVLGALCGLGLLAHCVRRRKLDIPV